MITIYGIKSCDTVRKAIKWLDSADQKYQYHDFRVTGLDQQKLNSWIKIVGWEKLLNTRSTTWRQLDEQQKQNITQASATDLMLQNPTLIKRPVVEFNNQLMVGFNTTKYQQLL